MDGKLRNMTSIFIRRQDRMLMLYRIGSRVAPRSWCGIGGHFEPEHLNDAKACMLRELEEEMAITPDDLLGLKLRYVTLRLKNDEIRQNYYFFADLKDGVEIDLRCPEGIPKWVAIEELEGLDMPFSAKFMMAHYIKTGQYTDRLYGGIAVRDRVVFTELEEF